MKKTIAMLIGLSLLLSSCGSSPVDPALLTEDVAVSTHVVSDEPQDESTSSASGYPVQELSATELPRTNRTNSDWLKFDIPGVGLTNLTLGPVEYGYVQEPEDEYKRQLPVYIFRDYQFGSMHYHFSYLAVVTDTKVLFKDLEKGSYDELLYVCDVDGDGLDEIVVQQDIGSATGAGAFISRIFKVVDDEIIEIFNPSPGGDRFRFETGFRNALEDGYRMEISNIYTGHVVTIEFDESNKNRERYFDETGEVTTDASLSVDSFYQFEPEDIDGDGVFEIVCLQYASLSFHGNRIGWAKSILKYNPETQAFEVIGAGLILDDGLTVIME